MDALTYPSREYVEAVKVLCAALGIDRDSATEIRLFPYGYSVDHNVRRAADEYEIAFERRYRATEAVIAAEEALAAADAAFRALDAEQVAE